MDATELTMRGPVVEIEARCSTCGPLPTGAQPVELAQRIILEHLEATTHPIQVTVHLTARLR